MRGSCKAETVGSIPTSGSKQAEGPQFNPETGLAMVPYHEFRDASQENYTYNDESKLLRISLKRGVAQLDSAKHF